MNLAICIGCGCDDNHACAEGCWWLRVDHAAGKGICSECEDHVEAWDRGDRTPHAESITESEAIAEGRLWIQHPEQSKTALHCKGNHDRPFEDIQDTDTCRWCGMSFLRHIFTEFP
jgi:hypothetical protein